MNNLNFIQLATDVFNGEEEALKALSIIEPFLKEVQQCRDAIYADAVEEAEKYSEKTFEKHGFTFTKRTGGASHSYKHINQWVDVNNKKKAIEAEAQQAFKAVSSGLVVFSEDDGSEIEPSKVTFRKDSLTIKKINQ